MCLLMYYLNPLAKADEFYLVIANVRDEMYNRPTRYAQFWDNHPDVIGGIDREPGKQGGTWFAVSKTGKIAALLNVLQPDEEIAADKKGRGFLVVDYVTGNEDCYRYLNKVCSEKDSYNGFTLVTLDISTMKKPKAAYFSNISTPRPEIVDSTYIDCHAFGNSTSVECPWPKVTKAKDRFWRTVRCFRKVEKKSDLIDGIMSILSDDTWQTLNDDMRRQGQSKSSEFMKNLSSTFVSMPEYNYGTRCQTVFLIDGSGKAHYYERSRSDVTNRWKIRETPFEMKCAGEAAP